VGWVGSWGCGGQFGFRDSKEGRVVGGGKAEKVRDSRDDSSLDDLDAGVTVASTSSSFRFFARLRWFWNQFVML